MFFPDSREEMVLGSIPLPSYEIRTAFSKEKKNRRFVFKVSPFSSRTLLGRASGLFSQVSSKSPLVMLFQESILVGCVVASSARDIWCQDGLEQNL